MESTNQLANRLKEVLIAGEWIANTNYMKLISDLNLTQATDKIRSLNTIAALTFHVNYYIEGVLNVFNGGKLEIKDKYSYDFPALKTEEDWQKMITRFEENSRQFVHKVEQMSELQLDEVFEDEKYGSYRRNIEGLIEHSYYHLGQISLIKKMILEK